MTNTADDDAIRRVIVGTAGHIDHGKSSIVKALTGIDPDRLEEERERGMTIDLGFARYRHRSGALVGIIDVPGHERFIKNMVAGATSVDVVALIVAADDGVMPQTREHLDILRLLGVERGLVVVTKIDLVDDEMLELALEDIRDFVAGTFLEGAPMVPVSATRGDGLDALREVLDGLVDEVPVAEADGPFRLPVQRVFSAAGHGTVATGVPVSGRAEVGDTLEVVGHDDTARVRGIQAYGEVRGAARAGHSVALNVTGVARDDLTRGDVLATPGVFVARRHVLVHYSHVDGDGPVRHNAPVRVHAGTTEVLGRLVVLDGDAVEVGDPSFVQLRLEAPIVVAPGDRVLVRHAASMVLLGGGSVLATTDGRLKRFKDRVLEEARERIGAGGDRAHLLRVALSSAGQRGATVAQLAHEVAATPAVLREQLAEGMAAGDIVAAGELYLAAEAIEGIADDALAVLRTEHRRQPLMEWLDVRLLRNALEVTDTALAVALEHDARIDVASGGKVRRRGHRVQLPPEVREARERWLTQLSEGGAAPPQLVAGDLGLSDDAFKMMREAMRASGEVVTIDGLDFAGTALETLRARLLAHGRSRDGAVVIPELRDEFATTRKYLIPLLERFDSEGLTVRDGEHRRLRPKHLVDGES